jgi:hypothetical protein
MFRRTSLPHLRIFALLRLPAPEIATSYFLFRRTDCDFSFLWFLSPLFNC